MRLGGRIRGCQRQVMEAERACALAEQWPADLKGKLGEVEMRLTQAKSVILA